MVMLFSKYITLVCGLDSDFQIHAKPTKMLQVNKNHYE